MRYSSRHKAEVRQQIIRTASCRFRSEGMDAVGIANLMADLGLTHGGFYSHFRDKEALVAAACRHGFDELQQRLAELLQAVPPEERLAALVEHYLSPEHRDRPDDGCVAAALGGEVARRDQPSRQAFTAGVEAQLALLANCPPLRAGGAMTASAALALMVGALLLSRAVSDPALSLRFLDEAKRALAPPTE
ncbi:TetR/AcrR family transcriptional regulator [Pseudogulbenkiania sp. MAI-1]|uniref:TetR/AcrR family transcriptional regulator n=1 Tax=Pseudogulbenkiania sp. MAI-1 TaxID=990370 RepID=UPI00045E72A4|nr:TetR/AcrR family transcriptional regulator [Pseudogulbenkiania sp. MAI-1]